MKRVLNSAALALLVAARAAAAQGLTIDWSRTAVTGGRALAGGGPDGATVVELRAGSPAGTSIHLVTIDHPPVTGGAYVVSGQLRYDGVEGQGYLEMWSVFPDGQRFFSRTLGTAGTLAALHGASGWRRFELPFDPSGGQTPSRLEINLVLPARGTVWLGPLRLERYSGAAGDARGAWWNQRSGILFGVSLGSLLGLVGATIGVLGGRGKARRLVLGLLLGMIVVGGALVVLGTAAALSAQPRHVWYPALALGGLSAMLALVLRRPMKLRYAADELRRIQAMDARPPQGR